MQEIGRDGHRSRMRRAYLSGNMDNAPDHNLLELFLSIIIPRKDVKQLSYDLLNRFGSLEGIIKASPYELMSVNGIGESTAIALSLLDDFNRKISVNKNKEINRFQSVDDCFEYCRNILGGRCEECAYIVTLTAMNAVIGCYKVGDGDVNHTNVSVKDIITHAINDKASSVMLMHNHPSGTAHPSGEDAYFTVKLKDTLDSLNVRLFDHIIVGENDVISLKKSKEYMLNL